MEIVGAKRESLMSSIIQIKDSGASDQWTDASVSPSIGSLADGDVDVWRVDLDHDAAGIQCLSALLSVDEKKRADRFVFARHRERFIAARGELRRIISGYLRTRPEEITFSVRKFGKPDLLAESSGLKFNVSHSQGTALIAIAGKREVGVDIEFVDHNFDVLSVASTVFSESEVFEMRSLPTSWQAVNFFTAWTRKEACLKAIGDGLSSSEEIQAVIRSLGAGEVSFRTIEAGRSIDWSLTSLSVSDDLVAAIAIQGDFGNVRFRDWTGSGGELRVGSISTAVSVI